jgi:hypothetical protein
MRIDIEERIIQAKYPVLPYVRDFTFVGLATFMKPVIQRWKFLKKQIVLVMSSHYSDIFRRDSCG